MALTPEQRLEEALAAQHAIAIGQATAEVRDSDGSSVRFTTANLSKLADYIEDLRAEISGRTAVRRPIRPFFG